MSDYPKIIERPWQVLRKFTYSDGMVEWDHLRSFWNVNDAEVYAEKMSGHYESVKIEKKETE